jgi:hypothetical protein
MSSRWARTASSPTPSGAYAEKSTFRVCGVMRVRRSGPRRTLETMARPVRHHHVAALEHGLVFRRGDRVEVKARGEDQLLQLGHDHRLDEGSATRNRLARASDRLQLSPYLVSLAAGSVVVDVGANDAIVGGFRAARGSPQLLLEPPLLGFERRAVRWVADRSYDQRADDRSAEGIFQASVGFSTGLSASTIPLRRWSHGRSLEAHNQPFAPDATRGIYSLLTTRPLSLQGGWWCRTEPPRQGRFSSSAGAAGPEDTSSSGCGATRYTRSG